MVFAPFSIETVIQPQFVGQVLWDRLLLKIGKYGIGSLTSISLPITEDANDRMLSAKVTKTVIAEFCVGYAWAATATEVSNLRSVEVVHVKQYEETACTIR